MDESITRAAGGGNGQLCDPARMAELAAAAGRPIRQRNTLYGPVEHTALISGGTDDQPCFA